LLNIGDRKTVTSLIGEHVAAVGAHAASSGEGVASKASE
jgi:hypothetical protein